MRLLILLFCGLFFISCQTRTPEAASFSNTENTIRVDLALGARNNPVYMVYYKNQIVLDTSDLGIVMEHADFSENLKITHISAGETVSDSYSMLQGKQKEITYTANKHEVHLINDQGDQMTIIFQISDDGVAFRYHFPGETSTLKKISEEKTSYNFIKNTKAWLQPMSKAKTGWEGTNPSYEEPYEMEIPITKDPAIGEGWVYPALFQNNDTWIVISETGLHRNYVGSRLTRNANSESLQVSFPQEEEIFPGGELNPSSSLPWFTPWRIISIGSLKTIAESTLGTDLAEPAIAEHTDYIETGLSSWSWVLLKDASVNYDTTKKFIDYASQMKWKYCLIDINWDRNIGQDGIKELADYAREKNVKIIVWYNSAGSWNTTPYTPKSKLLTREDRIKEFSMLKELGVAGVKIDFFGGDGQSMIAYYHDILEDTGDHELLVNFHGATLPRGWQRTYPHLLTVEAIKGYEFITFTQETADAAPSHAALLPFTRNIYDPMDYTPTVLDSIPGIHRRTTPGFELALPVLFLSGIQHIAEIPEGMYKQPDYVVNYLKDIPVNWDESRYVSGFPGKYAVFARRKDQTWHITGINGENMEKEVEIDLSFLSENSNGFIIYEDASGFVRTDISGTTQKWKVIMQPYGGFVMKFN